MLRIIAPGSKLANLTGLQPETAQHSLAGELRLQDIEKPELYEALDWLLKRQTRIENKLAKKHFQCLLKDLGTQCKHRVRWDSSPSVEFERVTLPTDLQRRVFELLGLSMNQ